MKKLAIILLALIVFSCKKETVAPVTTTVTVHDTIVKNTIIHDTTYCTPLSDIIQGTWFCYKYKLGTQPSPSDQVVFTQTTYNWNNLGSGSASFSSNYSIIYFSGTPAFTMSVYNCNELALSQSGGQIAYLRRNP